MKRIYVCILTTIVYAIYPALSAGAAAWQEFAVAPSTDRQTQPDVHGDTIVWQQYVDIGGFHDWDIYAAKITATEAITVYPVAPFVADQTSPRIFADTVTWQDNYWGDWDVYITDVRNPAAPAEYLITHQRRHHSVGR